MNSSDVQKPSIESFSLGFKYDPAMWSIKGIGTLPLT